MSEPIAFAPPDLGSYIDLRLFDVPDQALIDAMISYYEIVNPGWIAREGNTEVLLMETIALGNAESVVAINRLPGAVIEAILQLAEVGKDYGAPGFASATVTVADGLGYVIPTGTRFYLPLTTGAITFLSEAPDVTIPAGQTEATVPLVTEINTGAANGVQAPTRLVLADQLYMVQSVALASTVTGGRDPETDEQWRDRGVARFRRFSDALTVPRHFDAAVDEDPRVGRVLTVDLWDGSVVTPGDPGDDPGHVTVAVLGTDGAPLDQVDLDELEAMTEALAAAMLDVHVLNAVTDEIDIVAVVHVLSGFVEATVLTNAQTTLREYLDPLNWLVNEPVRHNELVSVLDQSPGVDYVVSITANGSSGDIALSSPRSLPVADTVTVTAGS